MAEQGSDMQHYNVLIVEDDKKQAELLKSLVSANSMFSVSGCAASYADAVSIMDSAAIDMAIIDIDLKGTKNGIDVIKHARKNNMNMLALVYTIHSDSNTLFDALKAGANGYILKCSKTSELAKSIEGICEGEIPISPMIARKILNSFRETADTTEQLTERELEMLIFVDRGFSHKQIAENLNVSINTVYTHFRNIYQKFQVNSKDEALEKAKKLSII